MAEKEERIAIIKWNTKNSICTAPTELQCGGAKSCDDCKVGMSRQEAINLIEKVLEEGWWSSKTFRQLSDDVLNTLLSEGE